MIEKNTERLSPSSMVLNSDTLIDASNNSLISSIAPVAEQFPKTAKIIHRGLVSR